MKAILLVSLIAVFSLTACKKKAPVDVGISSLSMQTSQTPSQLPESVRNLAANFSKVYFDFDAASLDREGQAALKSNAQILLQATDIKIEVQGHADERGTTDYNIALGQKRADSIYKILVAEGVPPSRLSTLSYGEERPVDPTHTEIAWSKNRRAEFRITWGQTTGVTGTTN